MKQVRGLGEYISLSLPSRCIPHVPTHLLAGRSQPAWLPWRGCCWSGSARAGLAGGMSVGGEVNGGMGMLD